MHRHIVVSILVFAFSLSATAETSSLQEVGGAAQQQADTAQQPLPVLEGQVPSRADLVAADLRRIDSLLPPRADVSRVDSTLADREATIVALLGELDSIVPERISRRRLEDQRLPWLELRGEFAAWASLVRLRFDALQDEREQLRVVRDQWEATAESAVADELAPELLRRIDDLLIRIVDVEGRVRARRNVVAAIVGRVSTSQDTVTESLARIDAFAEQIRDRMFNRDAAPIWRELGAFEVQPLVEDAAQAREYWVRAFLSYLSLRRGRLASLVVLFVVLLLGALGLRRRSRGWSEDDEAAKCARRLSGRPFSVALAFALAMTMLVLPAPVGSAVDVLLLLAIVPVIRLGSVVLAATARRSLYGVTALVFLARVSSLPPDGSPLQRILLLLVTILAGAGAVLVARRGRTSAAKHHGLHRAAVMAAAAAAVLLVVALGANVFGWLAFSRMLTEATVGSAFGAVAWMVLVAAAAALLPGALGGRLGSALPSLRRNQATVRRTTMTVVTIVALLQWAQATLSRFEVYESLRTYATTIANAERSIGGLTISVGGILGAILILIATRLLAGLVRFALREEVLPRVRMPAGSGHSVITLANYTVYAVGIVLAASAAGLNATQVTVVVGALSVGIGFGLQNVVNNFVSGLILIFERPIKVGDRVQTTDFLGTVTRIGIRASTIRRFDGAEIIVPNGDLIAQEVINWTRSDDLRRIEALVGVAYGTDPETVLEILLRLAEEHPLTLADPEPKAQMIKFGDSSLDFRVRCWTRMDDFVEVTSDLHVAINKKLEEAGITIPFPQRDLHVRSTVAATKDEPGPA